MNITAAHIDGGTNASPGSSVLTNSASFTAKKLYLVAVASGFGTQVPTLTGASMTWVEVGHKIAAGQNITVFRGMPTTNQSGALTIDFGGVGQSFVKWSTDEFTNVDISGTNGSGAIVQSASNSTLDPTSSTGLTVTLSAFSNTGNATYGALSQSNAGDTITNGSGFTRLFDQTTTRVIDTQWKNSNDTTVDWSWSTSTPNASAFAIEIKLIQAAAGGFFLAAQ